MSLQRWELRGRIFRSTLLVDGLESGDTSARSSAVASMEVQLVAWQMGLDGESE